MDVSKPSLSRHCYWGYRRVSNESIVSKEWVINTFHAYVCVTNLLERETADRGWTLLLDDNHRGWRGNRTELSTSRCDQRSEIHGPDFHTRAGRGDSIRRGLCGSPCREMLIRGGLANRGFIVDLIADWTMDHCLGCRDMGNGQTTFGSFVFVVRMRFAFAHHVLTVTLRLGMGARQHLDRVLFVHLRLLVSIDHQTIIDGRRWRGGWHIDRLNLKAERKMATLVAVLSIWLDWYSKSLSYQERKIGEWERRKKNERKRARNCVYACIHTNIHTHTRTHISSGRNLKAKLYSIVRRFDLGRVLFA